MSPKTLVAAIGVALVACAGPAEPPSIRADLIDGPSQVRELDAAALVEDLSDSRLAGLLDDAGFAVGTERTWTDRQSDVWRTVVQGLRFDSPEGARTYLAWIRANPSLLIGAATPARGDDDVVVFEHEPDDCCPNKDVSGALAAATRGEVVWLATLMGPGADAHGARKLFDELEATWR